jgi:hypothetical protein
VSRLIKRILIPAGEQKFFASTESTKLNSAHGTICASIQGRVAFALDTVFVF